MSLQIEQIEIEKLIPYARNTRTHSKEQITKITSSIKEFGFTNPVLIDKDNGIIAGHGRVIAAEKMKLKTVPCIRLGYLTEAQKKAYIIADNRLALDAGWDEELLKLELEELKDELGFDIGLIGFTDEELNKFFQDPNQVQEDDFDAEKALEEIEEPVSKTGDVWFLGRHRLVCGDSTKSEFMAKLMGNQQADLVLTDPPYNVDYEGATKDKLKIQNDKMEDDKFLRFLTDAFSRMNEYSKKGAAIYVFHADSEGYNFRTAFKLAGYSLRQCLVWAKNTIVMGRQDYQWQHEPILYGWKDGASHSWYSDRKQTTLIHYDKPQRSSDHPTMKPVGLIGYLISNSSKEGDIVLDPFGGSGSTLIACEQSGRTCFTMEMDPKYCDIIVRRFEELTGQKAQRSTKEE